MAESAYWESLAGAYAAVGPPLSPSAEDVALVEDAVTEHARRLEGRPLRALILGVTPRVAAMRWPGGTSLIGADGSSAMARGVWPGNVAGHRSAICANWTALPIPTGSLDIVTGDGSFNCVRYPDGLRAAAEAVSSVLRPDGRLILRAYARPEPCDSIDRVFDDVIRGAIPTFTHFKFRLLMAAQRDARSGVMVDDVYRIWEPRASAVREAAARSGWPRAEVFSIDLYRGASTVHTFPSVDELRLVLYESFEELACRLPAYFDGNRCPTFVFRPRIDR